MIYNASEWNTAFASAEKFAMCNTRLDKLLTIRSPHRDLAV